MNQEPTEKKCCSNCIYIGEIVGAGCSNLHCDCHIPSPKTESDPFKSDPQEVKNARQMQHYERDHSHYHCWDTTEGDEGINGQEGHEKHLACCICRKRPESKTGKTDCELYEHVPTPYDGAFWYCVNCGVELDFVPVYSPKHPKPEAKTSDEVVEEIITDFHMQFDNAGEDYDGSTQPIKDWLRSTLTDLVERVREEANSKGYMQGHEADVIFHKKSFEEGKKEGALAVLADLEKRVTERTYSDMSGNSDEILYVVASLRASIEGK